MSYETECLPTGAGEGLLKIRRARNGTVAMTIDLQAPVGHLESNDSAGEMAGFDRTSAVCAVKSRADPSVISLDSPAPPSLTTGLWRGVDHL
jgi:hypothetical protein